MSNKTFSKATYREALLDPRWQKMRLKVYERDHFKCRACGDEQATLHAHHVYYSKESIGPWDYPENSIITLCASCHERESQDLPGARERLLTALSGIGICTASDITDLANALITEHRMSASEVWLFWCAVRSIIVSREVACFGSECDTVDGSLWQEMVAKFG